MSLATSAVILEAGEIATVTRDVPVFTDPLFTVGDVIASGPTQAQDTQAATLVEAASVKTAIAVETTIPSLGGNLPRENTIEPSVKAVETANPENTPVQALPEKDDWARLFKGSQQLSKKGEGFTLPSGEACVKIPNSVIEKHQKSWNSFIIGQFYSDPPSQGTIHSIVNGIWSRQFHDISVVKLDGNAFLFRIPNAQT